VNAGIWFIISQNSYSYSHLLVQKYEISGIYLARNNSSEYAYVSCDFLVKHFGENSKYVSCDFIEPLLEKMQKKVNHTLSVFKMRRIVYVRTVGLTYTTVELLCLPHSYHYILNSRQSLPEIRSLARQSQLRFS
jgi:hypothetical protein